MVDLKQINEKLDFILENDRLKNLDILIITYSIFLIPIFFTILYMGLIKSPIILVFFIIPILAHLATLLINYIRITLSPNQGLELRVITFSFGWVYLAIYILGGPLIYFSRQIKISLFIEILLMVILMACIMFVGFFTRAKLSHYIKKNFPLHFKKYGLSKFSLECLKRFTKKCQKKR